jgi:DNA-binding CsgD family transcriptional regulator
MLGRVATERERARCRERLERLSSSTQDCMSVQREAIADLQRVLGFDRWCWPFADPDTLLPLSGVADHDYGPHLRRALELEFSGGDFAAKHVLARRTYLAGSLSSETGGDLARSPRWDEVMRPVGIGDIAIVACRDPLGCWGWIEAYRDGGDRRFDDGDLDLLASVGASLGSVLRRGSVVATTTKVVVESTPPGVLVLSPDLGLVNWTAPARAWIDALPAAQLFATWNMLPASIYPAATLARTPETLPGAHALERAADGRWVSIEAAPLEGDEVGRLAVTIRAAAPPETFELLCRAYALTQRERNVVAVVLEGLDTRAVTERLCISRHTVQDHLKSVFNKIGIHSRRELLTTFNAPVLTE